ncbi:hypothetical protein ACU4GA_29595 [Methylobacterium oryzae CBMB20]
MKVFNDDVIRPLDRPIVALGGTAILYGNLAPDGCVIKPPAADPRFLQHSGPALVFDSYDAMSAAVNDLDLDVTPDHVMVLRNAGPIGGPGMPEWGMLPIPKVLLRQGVRDMVRISDARMSGTSYGACILHVAPEPAAGGLARGGARRRPHHGGRARAAHPPAPRRGRDRRPGGGLRAAGPGLSPGLQPAVRPARAAGARGLRLRLSGGRRRDPGTRDSLTGPSRRQQAAGHHHREEPW